MAHIVRAALTGLGAFISELVPAQAVDRAHDIITHEDPAATGAAAPSPEHHAGDNEPAGVTGGLTPAGSTSELTAADLSRAAGALYSYVMLIPDLPHRHAADLRELADRLMAASRAVKRRPAARTTGHQPPTPNKRNRGTPLVNTQSVSVVWTPADTQALRETADRHPAEAGAGTVDSDDAGLEQK